MSEVSDYDLSRAYSSGWTAAKKNFSDKAEGAINPFADSEAEKHARWAAGYAEALASVASVKDARFD
ncbi:MAG: hypothetical protein ACOH12_04655 [Parvibaculaceae bacterium]